MNRVLIFIVVLFLAADGLGTSRFKTLFSRAKAETEERHGKLWVVLVAGSASWMNYRHQADVCHLYKFLTKHHNVPQSQIIVMMYNDIAFNEENKYPGTIINALHGTDVYEGTMIDYMGEDVTPQNFLKILRGERMHVGSRKTLASGPRDNVFVNFVDHGDTGVLAFPDDELHLVDLNRTLHHMHDTRKYNQMLWYVEACFSGSMFEDLSPFLNVTALTAANAEESSYACVFDDDIGVYLGDCWSLNWMNNTEQIYPRLYKETVAEQYQIVKEMTTESHPSVFGDLINIYQDKLSAFFGHPNGNVEPIPILSRPKDAVPAQDVFVETLKRRRERQNANVDREIEYHEKKEEEVRGTIDQIVGAVVGEYVGTATRVGGDERRQKIGDPQCNKDVLSTFYRECYRMQDHPYVTKYTFRVSNLCNTHNPKLIVDVVEGVCGRVKA